MNYIYDILVNYNSLAYEFYEWNPNDNIYHIRRIPLMRVSSKTLRDFKIKQLEINTEILEKIKNRTEYFYNKGVKSLEYAFIVSDSKEVVAVLLNNSGKIIKRSKLLLDEELEVLEMTEQLIETKFEYSCNYKLNIELFKTRKDVEIHKYIKKELHSLLKNSNLEKLKYIYFECFNERQNNQDEIMKKILNGLENNWNQVAYKLYGFFKLTSINK